MITALERASPRAELERRIERPPARGMDVLTTLGHFALISYQVPLDRLRPHVDPTFEIVSFEPSVPGAGRCGLVSVVPFFDYDFRFCRLPFLRFSFGQTNYRLYVRDRAGDPLAWFFGTALDTAWVAIPHSLWQLPWYRARMRFAVEYSEAEQRYMRYRLTARSAWAAADFTLTDAGTPMELLPGFTSLDEQRLILTHPVRGVFRRRDGALGTYSIWHPEMQLTSGGLESARFDLLSRLGLLNEPEQQRPHSVLIQPQIEFQIALPPQRCS